MDYIIGCECQVIRLTDYRGSPCCPAPPTMDASMWSIGAGVHPFLDTSLWFTAALQHPTQSSFYIFPHRPPEGRLPSTGVVFFYQKHVRIVLPLSFMVVCYTTLNRCFYLYLVEIVDCLLG